MRHTVESEYNMQGMGQLLQLYGGAAQETEAEYQRVLDQFKAISKQRKRENDTERKAKMKSALLKLKERMDYAKEKLSGYSRGAMKMLMEADSKLEVSADRLVKKIKEDVEKDTESIKSFGRRLRKVQKEYSDGDASDASSVASKETFLQGLEDKITKVDPPSEDSSLFLDDKIKIPKKMTKVDPPSEDSSLFLDDKIKIPKKMTEVNPPSEDSSLFLGDAIPVVKDSSDVDSDSSLPPPRYNGRK
jgi:hypothetical protein